MASTRETIEKWFINELKFKEINSRNGTVNCGYCALELHKRIVEGGVVSDKPVPTRDARIRLEVDYLEDTVTRVFSEDPRITQPFSKSGDEALVLSIDISTGEEYYIEKNKDGTKERVRFTVYDCEREGVDGLYKMLQAQTPDAAGVCFGLLSLSQQDREELVVDNGLIVGHIINYYISGDEIFFLDAQEKTISHELDFTYFKKQISYVQAKHRPEFAPSQESVLAKSESSNALLAAIPTGPASQAVANEVSFYDNILEAARKQDETALQRTLKQVSIDIRRLGNPYYTPAGQLAAEGALEAVSFLRDHGAAMGYIARGAAMGGRIEYVEELRKQGAHINLIAQGAAIAGHREYAEELRKQGAHINLIAQGAAMGGHREYAEELRKQGANINLIAQSAATGGHREYVEELRAAGANIDLIAQGAALSGQREYAQELRAAGANIDMIALGAAQGGYNDYAEELRAAGANIKSIAIGLAASGRISMAENLRIEERVAINFIAQGAVEGGHIEYAEKLRAAGANIGLIASVAAMRGHREYAEELGAKGVSLYLIAKGAARGGYVDYAEKLRKDCREEIDRICTSDVIGVFEMKKRFFIEYKKFVNSLAKHAAEGGHEVYAEYLRINEGADIKCIAQGAARGGYVDYVEKLYLLNQGVNIADILDNALFGGQMMYAENLWGKHEKFANSTPCDAENKRILCEEHKILTEHFVNSVLKYGKIKYAESLRIKYNIDVNLIVKYAALYNHERYILRLCWKEGANVSSIKAASDIPGISFSECGRLLDMHEKVKKLLSARVNPNASIHSRLEPFSGPVVNSSSTSDPNPNPVSHQRGEREPNAPISTSITENPSAFPSSSTNQRLPDAAKRKRNDPEFFFQTEQNKRKGNAPNASTPTRTSENRSTFLSSSSSTTANYPIVPLPPVFSPKKTN